MSVVRVERVVYGVADVDECARFFEDFGLTQINDDQPGVRLHTRVGQVIELLPIDDPSLPPAVEQGSTLREVVWGVDSQESMDAIVPKLGADREVSVRDGVAHTIDESGFGVGVTLVHPNDLEIDEVGYNRMGDVTRINEARTYPGPVHPLRLCHVALNIEKEGLQEARAFYLDRLGFVITDDVPAMGVFMRADGDADQHTMLLCHRPDKAGINHCAFEVEGFDQVVVGANHMIEQGWREARKLGRHTVGSNVFRFVHAPCGGRVEFAADMDRVDDSYGPNFHDPAPPHHIWQLASNREQEAAQ